uniref:NADH-ubiquinone oxidoreductase chain 5 n=1 Tax=Luciosoma bleekeri TaxID=643386 RepID=F3Y6Q2_9TELE|nr:NADH dehydrogenase subunit 5 [Luciosoma bleekeri]BAK23053.1 NADH dehydrogenase subunit 5 [Luciosoma bleekeri]
MPQVVFMISMTITLGFPILLSFLPSSKRRNWSRMTTTAVKASFFVSLIPATIYLHLESEAVTTLWHWMNTQAFSVELDLLLDHYSLFFMPVALYVTWSILEFALWYMHDDPHQDKFFKYLLMFLIFMMILVTANNLFQLFIGWEGVGVMSFLLIGWWYGRANANTASLQAIIYNRMGDVGFVVSMCWFATSMGTWQISQIAALSEKPSVLIPLFGLIIAAMGKSSQFFLHPWLPAAMEGPTPVSALLHSSTMVVAGIFLLIRFHVVMQNSQLALTVCLYLGALTTLFAATCALTQNDIKKIVAFSTSSQLGLMMVALGLNQPHLAFLHICTHAFFKAMLFMCSGAIIHSFHDEQDIRKMGGLLYTLPGLTTYFMIGNLALVGTPFLAGFFSKDAIIEALGTSFLNAGALAMTLLATCFTATYTFRMLNLVALGYPRTPALIPIMETTMPTNAIKRLAWGSIVAGFIIAYNTVPYKTAVLTMPWYIKLAALLVTILGYIFAKETLSLTSQQGKTDAKTFLHRFITSLWFYSMMVHRCMPQFKLLLSQKIAEFQKTWSETLGPQGLSFVILLMLTALFAYRMTAKTFFKMIALLVIAYLSFKFV